MGTVASFRADGTRSASGKHRGHIPAGGGALVKVRKPTFLKTVDRHGMFRQGSVTKGDTDPCAWQRALTTIRTLVCADVRARAAVVRENPEDERPSPVGGNVDYQSL